MKDYLVKGLMVAGFISLGGLAGACSCGDDGGDGDGDGDGDADAAPDAPEITATRTGTIALTQLGVVDAELAALVPPVVLDGAGFTVEYDDLTSLGVEPTYTDGAVGCTVLEFDGSGGTGLGDEATEVDEGPVTLTGFGDLGNINCAFVSAEIGYQCAPAMGATGNVTTGSVAVGVGTATLNIDNADFTMAGVGALEGARGMTITFPDGTWDNTENDGTFPVLAVNGATNITISNPAAVAENQADGALGYTLGIGNAPVADVGAGPHHIFAVNAGEFNVAGGQESGGAIESYAEDITPATLDMTDIRLGVSTLDGNGDPVAAFDPSALPSTEFTISCDNANLAGNCNEGAPISALIVSGRTTDGALPNTGNPVVDQTDMPEPIGTYTTFRCVFLGQKSGTISQGALDAILVGNPTRIETRVIYAGGLINAEADGDRVNLLAGYGIIGFTDP